MSVLFIANVIALLISFFVVGAMFGALFSKPVRKQILKLAEQIGKWRRRDIELAKVSCNPVMTPSSSHYWEAEAVLNPAAVHLGNRVHLLYRAIGGDGISRLGYASTQNNIVIDERLPYPAYVAQNPRNPMSARRYSPALYPSGGSWGGCEDPRMVAIDDKVYVTFSIFDGWDFIRMAVISIDKMDFLMKKFSNWSWPTLLSKPGEIHKNWVLFPEKIDGKFAILHSVSPKVEIAYRDSLEAIGATEPYIESWRGARDAKVVNGGAWDTFVRGAGPPPLRTEKGWLLFYHAIDARDPHRYKLGAMLLDLHDPSTVLYRSSVPILMPDESYENEGKPGVVYACGAVIRDGMLYVYYGGADKVVCVAFAPLSRFLDALMTGDHAALMNTKLTTT